MPALPYGFSAAQHKRVQAMVAQLQTVNGIVAVALGGSFARGAATPTSDIDLGIYYVDDTPPDIAVLREIAAAFDDTPEPTVTELGAWGTWVNGGAWLTCDGQRVDWLYRSLDTLQMWITRSKQGNIDLDYYQQPATGFYSYMYLAELDICQPLADDTNALHALKAQVQPYPPALRMKIVSEFTAMAELALYHANVAAQRDDPYMLATCTTRIAAALVQIIYAQNERYFISDKGALDAIPTFAQHPPDFAAIITRTVTQPTADAPAQLRRLLTALT